MSRPASRPPDRRAMAKAVAEFLTAAGVDLRDPIVAKAPRRVARAWATELLTGYRTTAEKALGALIPVSAPFDRELVVVTGLRFRSTCPHHLLPYSGWAHVAYVPGRKVIGFGRVHRLVNAYAQRLILQEELARQVVRALMHELGSQGAACLLEAEQTCLRLRGATQHDAITHAEAYEGVLRERALRSELWRRVERAQGSLRGSARRSGWPTRPLRRRRRVTR